MRHRKNSFFEEYLRKHSALATKQELTHLFTNDAELRNAILSGEDFSRKKLESKLKKQTSLLPLEDIGIFPRGQRSTKQVPKKVAREWTRIMSDNNDTSSSSNDNNDSGDSQRKKKHGRCPGPGRSVQENTLNAVIQALGIERGTVQSLPSTLKHIVALLTDIQARVMTLSENQNRVAIDTVRLPRLPGDASQLLTRTTEAVAAKAEKLLSLKAALEQGDFVRDMKRLQQLAALFVRENPQFREKKAPWTLTFSDIETNKRGPSTAQSASAELRELTLQLFVCALWEADRIFNKGAIKKKKFSIEQRNNNVVTSTEEVSLVSVSVCMKDQPDWDHVQGGHIEFAVASFDRTTSTSGNLTINVNGPFFFHVLTDPNWRPISRNELDDAVYGAAAIGNVTQLSNRYLFVLRYMAHLFVHIAASVSTQFEGAAYEHPNNHEYRQLAEFYEPLSEPFS